MPIIPCNKHCLELPWYLSEHFVYPFSWDHILLPKLHPLEFLSVSICWWSTCSVFIWKCLYVTYALKIQFYWGWSAMLIVTFCHVIKMHSTIFWFSCFYWEVSCLSYCCSCIENLSFLPGCFKSFYLLCLGHVRLLEFVFFSEIWKILSPIFVSMCSMACLLNKCSWQIFTIATNVISLHQISLPKERKCQPQQDGWIGIIFHVFWG